MKLFKKTRAQIFEENTTEAEEADNFMVSEMPFHLQPWAFTDYRIVEKILKFGITADMMNKPYLCLPDQMFKRGERQIIKQMVQAAASGYLMLPNGHIPSPFIQNMTWDQTYRDYQIRDENWRRFNRRSARIASPARSDSPLEQSMPSMFDSKEQVISNEEVSSSPPSGDLEIPELEPVGSDPAYQDWSLWSPASPVYSD